MFEQINKNLRLQFNIKVTQQYLNRFTNVIKLNKNTLLAKKVPENTLIEIPYNSEFKEIKSIDDSF